MLLVLRYGHKQTRYFNLDCPVGNLMDATKQEITQDSIRTLREAEKRWLAASAELEEKIGQLSLKISGKKESEGKDSSLLALNNLPSKQSIQGRAEPKKEGGREVEFQALRGQLEASERFLAAYQERLDRIGQRLAELETLQKDNELKYFDLVDLTGERVFINRRLEQRAKGIVTPNKPYYLVRIEALDNPTCAFKPFAFEGLLVLSPEEDTTNATELNLFTQKKSGKSK